MYSRDLVQKIRELYSKKKNYSEVARILRMRCSTVHYMVTNDYSRPKRQRGPQKTIDRRAESRINVEVKRLQGQNEKVTASKIRKNCSLDLSVRTVQRAMKGLRLTYGKVPRRTPLQSLHKKKRVELAEKWIVENLVNKNVVFTDEKRFSFDGPDNWFSWYDPFNPPTRIKRQLGGGSVMVWGATLPSGELIVHRLDGRVNSSVYTKMLEKNVVPLLNSKYGEEGYIFQQDNCSVHVSKESKNFFSRRKIKLLEWVAYSPDMNIQENVWSMISEKVYENKQFFNKENLWQSIQDAVDEINQREKAKVRGLFEKYNNRLLTLIKNHGDAIPY